MNRALLTSVCLIALAAPATVAVGESNSGTTDTNATIAAGRTTSALAAVRQRASLAIYPPIAQNSPRVGSANAASVLGIAKFRPARKGRVVLIQRKLRGGAWKAVARKAENRAGVVNFVAADKKLNRRYTYRAVAQRGGGLRPVTSAAKSSAEWKMKFSDEFAGRRLNRSNWDYRAVGSLTEGDRTRSASSPKAVQVGRGHLSLQVRKNPLRPGYYLNGHIGSQDNFSFRYGITAARIKFEQGRGQHGSFWLQPQSTTASYGRPAATGAEIDVAEFFGQGYKGGGMAHFVYYYPEEGKTIKTGGVMRSANRALQGKTDSWWSRYHVFSVEWTPRTYVFRIDGVETWRTSRGVSRRPEFLILSLLSSDYELPKLAKRSLPTSMQVDWIRAWQN